MDGKLVSEPSHAVKEDDGDRPPRSYTEQFYEHFPAYLSMGMTYDLYWNGDPALVKYYRKAQELTNERRNQELWLQGYYFYEALGAISPILQAFAKKGTKAEPYLQQPVALTDKSRETQVVNKEKENAEKVKRYMMNAMEEINRKFRPSEDSESQ